MQIQQLCLQTGKLETLLEFYTGVLGLPLLEQTEDLFSVQVGSSRLTFEQTIAVSTNTVPTVRSIGGNRSKSGLQPVYHFAFNIPQNQLLEAKAWTEARVPLIPDTQGQMVFHSENWNANMFYFYDPAGNILELIARHGLGNASSQPFSWQSLENISELGVASLDPTRTAAQLELPLYRCQPNDTFMSVGDEQGLLIVVRQGRVWFPDTGKAADFVPFKVQLGDGRTFTEADIHP